MNADVQLDPFALPIEFALAQQDLESAWFDVPRRSSRPPFPSSVPQALPAPPIDDPVADSWFR